MKLKIEKIFSLLLALSPFLINYKIPIIDFSFTLVIYMFLFLVTVLNIMSGLLNF